MLLHQGLRLVRIRWVTIVVTTMVFLLVALIYLVVSPKTYRAQAKAFVSATPAAQSAGSASSVNAGGQFALSQMKSYPQLSDSGLVLQPVIDSLKLNESLTTLAGATNVTNPAGTTVLLISSTDHNAARAAAIANATATSLAQVIQTQQTVNGVSYLNVSVTTAASVPRSPQSPNQDLVLFLALIIGLAVGLIVAATRHRLDRSVRTRDQLQAAMGEAPLAVIPAFRDRSSIPFAVLDQSATPAIKAFRSVRIGLALGNGGRLPSCVVVASPNSADGRSVFAANLALSAADDGARVCLVDADLIAPSLGGDLGIGRRAGLSEVLLGQAELDDVLYEWHGLVSVVTAGNELAGLRAGIGSTPIKAVLDELSTRYDMVVIDTPAMTMSADALVIAQHVSGGRHARPGQDGIILLGRGGSTTGEELAQLAEIIEAADAHLLGAALISMPDDPGPQGDGSTAAISSTRNRVHQLTVGEVIEPALTLAVSRAAELPATELPATELPATELSDELLDEVVADVPATEPIEPEPIEADLPVAEAKVATDPASRAANERVLRAVASARGTASALATATRNGSRH